MQTWDAYTILLQDIKAWRILGTILKLVSKRQKKAGETWG